jgi:hypothetical protein
MSRGRVAIAKYENCSCGEPRVTHLPVLPFATRSCPSLLASLPDSRLRCARSAELFLLSHFHELTIHSLAAAFLLQSQ